MAVSLSSESFNRLSILIYVDPSIDKDLKYLNNNPVPLLWYWFTSFLFNAFFSLSVLASSIACNKLAACFIAFNSSIKYPLNISFVGLAKIGTILLPAWSYSNSNSLDPCGRYNPSTFKKWVVFLSANIGSNIRLFPFVPSLLYIRAEIFIQ